MKARGGEEEYVCNADHSIIVYRVCTEEKRKFVRYGLH